MCDIFSNYLIKNAVYTLADFHFIFMFIHIEIDRSVCANIHYYIELYKIKKKKKFSGLIRTRYFDSRINFLNKKFLIATFYCEIKQQKVFGYQGRS